MAIFGELDKHDWSPIRWRKRGRWVWRDKINEVIESRRLDDGKIECFF